MGKRKEDKSRAESAALRTVFRGRKIAALCWFSMLASGAAAAARPGQQTNGARSAGSVEFGGHLNTPVVQGLLLLLLLRLGRRLVRAVVAGSSSIDF
ncbi:hypothetical protein ACUV84_031281 [Puccinellia chinampoensis]